MTELTYLFAGVALAAGALASISIWAPRRVWPKIAALGTMTALLPLGYAGFLHLLSMPKPAHLEWWHANADKATVLGSSMHEGEAIYLWLQIAGVAEPRAYVLPWDRALAEQLQAARREAEQRQTQVRMRLPFATSLDTLEPKFYAVPQPKAPPKDLDRSAPMRYEEHRPSEA